MGGARRALICARAKGRRRCAWGPLGGAWRGGRGGREGGWRGEAVREGEGEGERTRKGERKRRPRQREPIKRTRPAGPEPDLMRAPQVRGPPVERETAGRKKEINSRDFPPI